MSTYGYIRVSTGKQIEGCSLDEQTNRIAGLAMMRNAEVDKIFVDAGVSGKIALDARPGGASLLETLECGDTLIVSKLDRIFRDATDALSRSRALNERGINLILCDIGTEPINSGSTEKLMFGVLALFAEWEAGRIAERLAEGRAAKKADGGHCGGSAPFGSRVIGEGRNARLEQVPEEQAILSDIIELSDAGESLRSIKSEINSRHGRCPSIASLSRIVREAA